MPAAPRTRGDAPRVRVVLLNFNGGDLVLRAVEHAIALDWPADALEVVVVDNASVDGSDRAIEARFPTVRVIRSETNRGFPGNNLAMADRSGVDFIALVNPDAFVPRDLLHRLVGAMAGDERIGAACPKILLADRFVAVDIDVETTSAPLDPRPLGVRLSGARFGDDDLRTRLALGPGCYGWETGTPDEPAFTWTAAHASIGVPVPDSVPDSVELRLASLGERQARLSSGDAEVLARVDETPSWTTVPLGATPYDVVQNAGSVLYEGGWCGDRGFLEPDSGQYDEPTDVFAWCGAAVLLRSSYLDDVGLFDESFFLYYEDSDLSWRGHARGWRYVYEPSAVVRHVHSASSVEGSPLHVRQVARNRLLMLTRNAPLRLLGYAVLGFLVRTASYARRDIVGPLLHARRPHPGLVTQRLTSFLAWVRVVPRALRDRRRLRRRQTVADDAITRWAVRR